MKKLIIAAFAIVAAVTTQAATVKWVTSGTIKGVDTASVGDNGAYDAVGAALKGNFVGTFTLEMYAQGTSTLVDSVTDSLKYKTGGDSINYSWSDTKNVLAQGTTYDFVLKVSGTQSDLQALGVKGAYDYSAATISAKITGQMTTLPSGSTTWTQDVSSWTVAGVTSAVTPEPTSGLLLLLGVAGLALRRRHA